MNKVTSPGHTDQTAPAGVRRRPSVIPEMGESTDRLESLRQEEYLQRAAQAAARLSEEIGRPLTFQVVTFGCQMNARDSEKLTGILLQAGLQPTEEEGADVVIFNTCTIRDNADQRLFGRLGRVSHQKRLNPIMKTAVCGCMTQEPGNVDKLRRSYPFVDLIFGTHNLFRFPEYLYRLLSGEKHIVELWEGTDRIVETLPVKRLYPFKSGVNITFGCNNFCTYCIVPYVRGRERSRTAEEILEEVRRLAADGVTEIMLLGQNVNSYGNDLEDSISFPELCRRVCRTEGIKRVRFMTPHPKDLSDELIEVIRTEPVMARHIHLPLQSGSTEILRRMNRRYTKDQYLELALKIRDRLPDVALSTDIIVGFPGETDADVEDTLDVIRRVSFDNAFTFIFSPRRGTPAAQLEDTSSEADIHRRFDAVLRQVQTCARARTRALEGQVMEGLVEEVNRQQAGYVTARLSNNLLVHIPGDASMIGQYLPIRLEDCRGFYYFGKTEECNG